MFIADPPKIDDSWNVKRGSTSEKFSERQLFKTWYLYSYVWSLVSLDPETNTFLNVDWWLTVPKLSKYESTETFHSQLTLRRNTL